MVEQALASKLCSIIIPYATYHTQRVEYAAATAYSQSVPCDVITIHDEEGRGAGWARNQGVALSNALFVCFLDADDTLREDAIERMIASYQPGKYVYTDDWQGDSLHQTADCEPYHDGRWHTVTCLVPTVLFRMVGGFDENLPGAEDLDLYLKLQANGICGVRCPHPLLSYSNDGLRSKQFRFQGNSGIIRQEIYSKWSGGARMGCGCAGTQVSESIPVQEGDVLAKALYSPRQIIGSQSGRIYPKPKGHENYLLSVDPRDVAAMPELWERVQVFDPVAVAPDVDTVMQLAREALGV